jgi:RND family efflux transporter MFP subunit
MTMHPFQRLLAAKRARACRSVATTLVLLAGAATASAAFAASSADGQPADAKAPAAGPGKAAVRPSLTVTLTQGQRADLAVTVAANGNITAWQEAIVGSEANGWRLAEVRANVGDKVRRGQVLATFAAELQQADLAQSRASLAESEAMLEEARANAQRARDLQATGALSAQQINQYLTAERTAQARLDALRAALKVQQIRLAQAQVLAPDDGVISARSATVGAVVPAGQELFRLIRKGRLEWRAEVAAADLAQIRPGMAATLATGDGSTLAGTVRMVAPTVDVATRNGIVYVDLPPAGTPGAAASAKPGMFARGEFLINRSAALTLPQAAVLLRDGFSYVYTVGPEGKVRQVQVQVGRRVGDRIEVTRGLDAQMRVVASGVGFLGDGDTVRVVDAPVAASSVKPVASR